MASFEQQGKADHLNPLTSLNITLTARQTDIMSLLMWCSRRLKALPMRCSCQIVEHEFNQVPNLSCFFHIYIFYRRKTFRKVARILQRISISFSLFPQIWTFCHIYFIFLFPPSPLPCFSLCMCDCMYEYICRYIHTYMYFFEQFEK